MRRYFEKKYEILDNVPRAIGWEEYYEETLAYYTHLLENNGDDEKIFQEFFEKNPAFMPGAFQLMGESGHTPYPDSLISQPELGNLSFMRKPDFIWLAQNSTHFTPVIIEIEKPNKKTFNKSGNQTADFTQALNQILEWKMILNRPENVLAFYNYFNIPDEMRRKKFEPQYCLIYGRRKEFENNTFLANKRAELASDKIILMTYDRISSSSKYEDLLCCKMKLGKYEVITIPPTYRYRPGTAEILTIVNRFFESIDNIQLVSEERKRFLKQRYEYWKEYGALSDKGMIHSTDKE